MRMFILSLLCLVIAACSATAAPTSTPVPTVLPATMAPTEPAPGDGAAYGELLFTTFYSEAGFACATCHYPTSEARLIGPGLKDISQRIAIYELDQSAADYLRASILVPDAFIPPHDPPFSADVMPKTYTAIFTDQELDDLVAYLLTL